MLPSRVHIVDFADLAKLLRREGIQPEDIELARRHVRHPRWADTRQRNPIKIGSFLKPAGCAVALVQPDLVLRENGTCVLLDDPVSPLSDTEARMHSYEGNHPILVARLSALFPEITVATGVPSQVARVAQETVGWETYVQRMKEYW